MPTSSSSTLLTGRTTGFFIGLGMAAALLWALAAVPASAKAGVDLRVGAASAPIYAQQGGVLPVEATVVRSGGGAGKTKLRFYVSRDARRGKGDVKLKPGLRVPALRGGARKRVVEGTVKVKTATAPRKYRLLACADDPGRVRERKEANNCRDAGPLTVTRPEAAKSSQALIAADLETGLLTEPEALVYRAFAAFDDPRLPAKYRGDAAADPDHGVFRELADAWASVPVKLRRKVAPLMAPPRQVPASSGTGQAAGRSAGADEADEDGECVIDGYGSRDWKSVSAANGNVVVHWDPEEPGHGAAAQEIAGYATAAWTHHLRVMGRPPLSDADVPCYHGPDGAVDIYVRPDIPRAIAVTMPSAMTPTRTPDCDGMPSFILTEPKGTRNLSLRFTIAHELFHAFQNAFVESGGCADHRWFDEGSANWAAHSTFPADQSEHLFSYTLRFPDTDLAIQDYHSWVFVLWMQKTLGEQSIRSVYTHGERVPAIQAVDRALGDWRKRFLDFARHAWNTAPVKSFAEWDGVAERPRSQDSGPITELNLFLAGNKKRTAYLPTSLAPRSRNYHPFAVTDPKLREIVFRNPFAGNPNYRVGAIITLTNGTTRFDDWSGRSSARYCRDNPSEDIAKLVVVSGNTSMAKPFSGGHVQGKPELSLRDSCEEFPWRFEVLAGSMKTQTIAEMPASGQHVCGSIAGLPIGGIRDLSVSTTKRLLDPKNVVSKQSNGSLRGGIYTKGTGGWFDTLDGCENLYETPRECHTTRDNPLSGGWTIGASIEAPSASAQTATLRWAIPDPDVGFFDADEEVCYVFEIWKALDADEDRQQIPLSKLKSGNPVTLTFKGSGDWTADQRGAPAEIHFEWETTLTIRRVDEDGKPL